MEKRYKISSLWKVTSKSLRQPVIAVVAIAVVSREEGMCRVGLITMPLPGGELEKEISLWSKTCSWINGSPNTIYWNTISESQFQVIIGDLFDITQFTEITMQEYLDIWNSK